MTLQLQVDGYGRLGEALSRYEGTRVFVFGGVSGEEVIAEVVSSRRGYIAARVNEVVRGMPERTAVQCPYFGHCTGCQWQHIAYPWQLQMKRDLVVRAMQEDGN
jgi:23S rRNA (uracil1939-C5)-methyltransferase